MFVLSISHILENLKFSKWPNIFTWFRNFKIFRIEIFQQLIVFFIELQKVGHDAYSMLQTV